MDAPRSHRLRTFLALPLLAVAIVAGGSTGLAGLQLTPVAETQAQAPEPPTLEVLAVRAVEADAVDRVEAEAFAIPLVPRETDSERLDARHVVSPYLLYARAAALAVPEPPAKAKPPAKASAKPTTTAPKPTTASAPREFKGRNHFWMPVLGIDKKVYDYPCPRKRPPDHYVYRWWCAGDNNVYLLGHASSVMRPLHDAYVKGRLRVGMAAWYADPNGKVTKYRITEWRVVRPEDSHWAITHQPVPSMTLQTCVGKNDEFRLNVRLVAVKYL